MVRSTLEIGGRYHAESCNLIFGTGRAVSPLCHPLMLFSFTKRDLVAGWSLVLGVGVGGVGAVAESVAEVFEGVRTAPHARSDASA